VFVLYFIFIKVNFYSDFRRLCKKILVYFFLMIFFLILSTVIYFLCKFCFFYHYLVLLETLRDRLEQGVYLINGNIDNLLRYRGRREIKISVDKLKKSLFFILIHKYYLSYSNFIDSFNSIKRIEGFPKVSKTRNLFIELF